MVEMSRAAFEAAVSDGLDQIPDELSRLMVNVVVLVEEEPPDGEPDDLLGLYDGVPLPERDDAWGEPVLPDRITIFRGPLTRLCRTSDELVEEIAVTVVHEVAHHFGVDDDRLHQLGWG